MKKWTVLAALLLALAGCQGAAPSRETSSPAGDSHWEEEAPQGASSPAGGSSGEEASWEAAVQPEGLTLPQPFFESSDGYSLELLTPIAYEMTLDLGRGGPRGFLTADCFPLFLGQGVGRYALASAEGELVTGFVYGGTQDGYWSAPDGVISMSKYGLYGLVDTATGQELTDFRYRSLYQVAGNDGIWRGRLPGEETAEEIITRDGQLLFSLEEGEDCFAQGETLVLFRDGGLQFYTLDQTDTPFARLTCQRAERVSTPGASDGLLLAAYDGETAILLDGDGRRLTDGQDWDYIGYFDSGFAPFRQSNGLYGVVDSQGRVVVEAAWEEIQVQRGGALVKKEGRWGAIARLSDPQVTIQPRFEGLYFTADSDDLCFREGAFYGLVDPYGQVLVPAQYEGMVSNPAPLEEGWYLVNSQNGPGSAMAVSPQGEILFAADYTVWSGMAGDEDWLLVYTPQGKCGFMDGSGSFPVPLEFDRLGGFLPGLEVAFAQKDGRVLLVDKTGRTVMETVFSDAVAYCPHTLVCAVEYTAPDGERLCGLARIVPPSQG